MRVSKEDSNLSFLCWVWVCGKCCMRKGEYCECFLCNEQHKEMILVFIQITFMSTKKILTGTTVGGKYVLGPIIGKGSFGEVYLVSIEGQTQLFAVKREDENSKYPQLMQQSKVMRNFDKIVGFPQVYWVGQQNRANYMVMDLLGPTLQDLFFMCGKKFSLKTVLMIADQMLHKIEHLHSQHYLHRDLKPENFLLGLGEKSHIIHLVDFGLCKRYKDPKTNQHIPYKENRPITGTVRYCSVRTHFGLQQSRRDDVQSIGFILIYFLQGSLPWQGVKANNKNEKHQKIQEKKLSTPVEVQCAGLPIEFSTFLNYTRTLKFEERPDYKFLRRLFRDLFDRVGFLWDYNFDWCNFQIKRQIETFCLKIKVEQKGEEINEAEPGQGEKVEFNDCVEESEIKMSVEDSGLRESALGSENVGEDSFVESDVSMLNSKQRSSLNNPRMLQSKKLEFW